MGEQAYLVAHQLNTHAVDGVAKGERHVATEIHRLGIVLKPHETHCVGSGDVQLRLLAHGTGIEIWFHAPIMAEGHIVLGFAAQRGKHQCQQKDEFWSKHVIITRYCLIYCHFVGKTTLK